MNSKPLRWRLPPSHQELLRTVLVGASDVVVTAEQRAAIRQICSAPERDRFEPEDFLIAFKLAIVDAANDVGIPPGPDRNEFLARQVKKDALATEMGPRMRTVRAFVPMVA